MKKLLFSIFLLIHGIMPISATDCSNQTSLESLNNVPCYHCFKNKEHDDLVKCITYGAFLIATIDAGIKGFSLGSTSLKHAIYSVLCAGITGGVLGYIGLKIQNKLIIINDDYKCPDHKVFCLYAK
jgi:hypothetical protein